MANKTITEYPQVSVLDKVDQFLLWDNNLNIQKKCLPYQILQASNIQTEYLVKYANINAAVTDIGAKTRRLIVSGTTIQRTLTANLSIPINIEVVTEPNSPITKDSTYTLNIENFVANEYKTFNGFSAGDVTLGNPVVLGEWWGAVGGGVIVDTVPMQSAIASLEALGGGWLQLLRKKYLTPGLMIREDVVKIIGVGGFTPATTDEGSWLIGASGSNTLTLFKAGGAQVNGIGLYNMGISGGDRCLVSYEQTVWFRVQNVTFLGAVQENIHMKGFAQQWFWDNVNINGGTYGMRMEGVIGPVGGGISLFDKSAFRNVRISGASEHGTLFEPVLSNSVSWYDTAASFNAKSGFVVNGGARTWKMSGFSTERNSFGQAHIVDTGSITTGTKNLTVTKSAFQNGDTMTVRGAGANGIDLESVIASGGGTVNLVLTDNASITVTSVDVTNALYDDLEFGGGAADILIESFVGGNNPTDNHRYDINLAGASNVSFKNIKLTRPYNDPAGQVGGSEIRTWEARQRLTQTATTVKKLIVPEKGRFSNYPSPEGGDIVNRLIDDAGTFGDFIVKDNNGAGVDLLRVVGETGEVKTKNTIFLGGSSTVGIFTGTGSPEGAVTANIGSLYIDTSGGAGTTLYVKEANNGANTGWSSVS